MKHRKWEITLPLSLMSQLLQRKLPSAYSRTSLKKKRSKNLIIHGMSEAPMDIPPSQAHEIDRDGVRTLLNEILSADYDHALISRIGKNRSTKPRLVKVILPSSEIVHNLLIHKRNYKEPVKIADDKIPLERAYLLQLKASLADHRNKGDMDKTIKYINERRRTPDQT